MAFEFVTCQTCDRDFLKDKRHINANCKFNHRFYCSLSCESKAKNKKQELVCENPICTNKFTRKPSSISFRNFCSRACYGTFVKQYNKLRHKVFRYCERCGTRIASRSKYCSQKCWSITHQIPKETLISELRKLARKLGRSPTRRECKHYTSCYKYFSSWNNALIEAGLLPHRSLNQKMYKRRQCKALDGHICNSVSELIIDNWLYHHHIDHEKEVPYPEGKFTSDWGISPTIFVEYFGLANDSIRYDKEIRKKQEVCQKNGIRLIEVYPKDLFPENNFQQIFKLIQKQI